MSNIHPDDMVRGLEACKARIVAMIDTLHRVKIEGSLFPAILKREESDLAKVSAEIREWKTRARWYML